MVHPALRSVPIVTLVAIAGLASLARAQRTWIVDPENRAGTDFTGSTMRLLWQPQPLRFRVPYSISWPTVGSWLCQSAICMVKTCCVSKTSTGN
jgi:hypothetical protein